MKEKRVQANTAIPTARSDRALEILFALAIPLHGVHSPIPAITYGEMALMLVAVLALFRMDWEHVTVKKPLIHMIVLYVLFVLLSGVVLLFRTDYDLTAIAVRVIRWSFYVFAAALLSATVDYTFVRRLVIRLAVFFSVVLIVQFFANLFFGKVLMLHMGQNSIGAALEGIYKNGVLQKRIWRFSSFFSEPAHFSYYCNLGLALLVFYRDSLKFKMVELACVSIMVLAVFLCSSTYGISLLAVQLGWFFWKYAQYRGKNPVVVLALFLFVLVGLRLFSRTSLADYLLYKFHTISQRERFQFAWQFLHNQNWTDRLLGVGIGNEEFYFRYHANHSNVYLNSVSLTYLYCGWLGIALVVLFFFLQLFDEPSGNPLLMVMFLVISLFSTAFYSPTMILFTVLFAGSVETPMWCGRKLGGAVT